MFEEVVSTVPTGSEALPLWVVADDPGAITESDETNNAYDSGIFLDRHAQLKRRRWNAGPDHTISLPNNTGVSLDGSVTDDGAADRRSSTVDVGVASGPGRGGSPPDPALDRDDPPPSRPRAHILPRLTASMPTCRRKDDVTVVVIRRTRCRWSSRAADRTITSRSPADRHRHR